MCRGLRREAGAGVVGVGAQAEVATTWSHRTGGGGGGAGGTGEATGGGTAGDTEGATRDTAPTKKKVVCGVHDALNVRGGAVAGGLVDGGLGLLGVAQDLTWF